MDRRSFVSKMSVVVGGAGVMSDRLNYYSPTYADSARSSIRTIVFQGDSITFYGRNKDIIRPNESSALGRGYVALASADIMEKYPELDLQIFNRGIGGNKVHQLQARWDEDCLDLKPDVVSILIGVNDHWHTVDDHQYEGNPSIYQKDYLDLLEKTKAHNPNVKLIIGEPFVLLEGTKVLPADWNPIFKEYQEIAASVARQFDAVFVPYQQIFDKALNRAPVSYWAPDGIHPSMAGAKLMADAWVKAFKKFV